MLKKLDSAVVLAIVTAYLFCSSTAYTNAYLSVKNLNIDALDRDFHQTLYFGLLVNFDYYPAAVGMLLLGGMFYVLRVAFYESFYEYKNLRRLAGLRKKLLPRASGKYPKHIRQFIKDDKRRAMRCFYYAVLSVLFLCLLVLFELAGKSAADSLINGIKHGEYKEITVNGKKHSEKLALFFCGSKACAAVGVTSGNVEHFTPDSYSIVAIHTKKGEP